ncbi:MAG: inorganic diphosphatase [Anaerolineae bacterium]|nr:inorganic diphosphatase [Anaerolineae bacterium]HPD40276.1 inorganic diphosphatase [Anaerolineae bacterium]HRT32060.1 inorganic diphosphatase [Anaerolineae bacterium]HXK42129.1 inorganic diphosphatase [Anaerolineae bacterium]
MANLWHELPPGPNANLDVVYVVVEVPKRSRNKFEYDKNGGFIKLDRVLYSSLHYPGDYGFIPRTHYDDGDPLDIIVMTNEPTFPGCVIEARPLGIFRMLDRGLADDKILAVPATDPLFDGYQELEDVPPHFLEEVAHFFSVYKDLQHIGVKVLKWEGREMALAEIERALGLYAKYLRTSR